MSTSNLIDMSEDIQGILTGGYKRLPHAKYILLHFPENSQPVDIMKVLVPDVTSSKNWSDPQAVNLALTYSGLKKMGLPATTLDGFSRPFKEGMNDPHRSYMLGDFRENAPEYWDFGAPDGKSIDLLLILFASQPEAAEKMLTDYQKKWESKGVEKVSEPIDSHFLVGEKEHFGFRDGIAQPIVKGLGKVNDKTTPIETGEVLLGYKDQYGELPRNPEVRADVENSNLLPRAIDIDGKEQPDYAFGSNGTYLIFRKLFQDVHKFWHFLAHKTAVNGETNEEMMIRMASKMMGRWPSGVPLSKEPDKNSDDPDLTHFDDFLYVHETHGQDKYGYKTPIGSHIRRTNPRDTLRNDPVESLEISQKHRLLRRGRPYGPALVDDLDPRKLLKKGDDGVDRGLLFISLCGDINRQFEFTQRDWVNSPKFDDLYEDADPVIGNHYQEGETKTDTFTQQQCPMRKRVSNLPQFVLMKGGAYFFMPGMRALKYLASL